MLSQLKYVGLAALVPFAHFAAVNASEPVSFTRLLLWAAAVATFSIVAGMLVQSVTALPSRRVAICLSVFILFFFSFPLVRFVTGKSSFVLMATYISTAIVCCFSAYRFANFAGFQRFWMLFLAMMLIIPIGRLTIASAQLANVSTGAANAAHMDYRVLGTAAAPLPGSIDIARPNHGAAIMGVDFQPKHTNSTVRVHVTANAFSRADTNAVLAVFRDGIDRAIALEKKPVAKGGHALFDFSFNVTADRRLPVKLQVRIGPESVGELLINGPTLSAKPAEVPFPSISVREIEDTPNAPKAGSARPDVYYLTLDAYPRRDTLKQVFEFDNTGFITALQSKGFLVAEHSYANYMGTLLSVPGAMEQKYIVEENDSNFWSRTSWLLSVINGNNAVFSHFQTLGYFVSKLNFLDECPLDAFVDHCYVKRSAINPWMRFGVTDLELSLIQFTPLFELVQLTNPEFFRSRVLIEDMDDVMSLIAPPNTHPRFNYAHIWLPHAPYRFESDCSWSDTIDLSGGDSRDPKRRFLNQVECANRKVLEFANRIVQTNPDAIILINSDHGSGFNSPWSRPYREWSGAAVDERFGNLNAMRLPERCHSLFYDTISPVNYFELVFACIERHPPHFVEDRIYLSTFEKSHPQYGRVWRYR